MLVLRDLGVGGAERVVVRLANYLAAQGLDTGLITLVGAGPLAAELGDGVQLHDLAAGRIRSAVIPFYRLLARLRPDSLLSTLPQVNALSVAVARSLPARPRVVVREANDPRHEAPYSRRFGGVTRRLLAAAYRRADLVIAVSEGVKAGVEQAYGVDPARVVALPNASLDDGLLERSRAELNDDWYAGLEKRIVCVARLSAQKDHATLLRAFASLEAGPRTGLVLIGSGPLEAQVRGLVDSLGLTGRVKIVTDETNPFRWLRSADLLVLSSRWEGSPNVLVEALALGVPVVATDCRSGPREILADGQFGELVPVGDVAALAAALRLALARAPDAQRLIERSRAFHIESVGPRWLAALLPR